QLTTHIGSAHPGQHEIEQNDVRAVAVELLESLLSVGGDRRRESLLPQQEGQRVGERLLVLDDQHPRHGFPPPPVLFCKTAGTGRSIRPPASVGAAGPADAVAAGGADVRPPVVSGWVGMRSVNVDPTPGLLHSRTSPPWLAATCLTMASPSPVPPVARERALSAR